MSDESPLLKFCLKRLEGPSPKECCNCITHDEIKEIVHCCKIRLIIIIVLISGIFHLAIESFNPRLAEHKIFAGVDHEHN